MSYSFRSVGMLAVSSLLFGFLAYADKNPGQLTVPYDEVFPLHVEVCAFTVRGRVGQPPAGGPGGHGILYVKGMCQDKSVPYPKVKRCGSDLDITDPNTGSLVSVNKSFKTTYWVATEGRDFAFFGNLSPNATITKQTVLDVIHVAEGKGIYRGVQVHEEARKELQNNQDRSVESFGIGTDYALSLARKGYCTRIPIQEAQLAEIIDHLNKLNSPYVEGKKSYQWSQIRDNCAHLIKNALAAAGMTSPISTNHNVITGLFDPIIPGNLALDIAEKAIPRAVPSVFNLYRDKQARDHFKKYKSLSIPPGASFEIIPMFVENNQFYQLHDSIFIIDYPYFGHRKERFSGMIENPEISDLRQHLRTWQSYFRRAIEECPHHPESQDQEFQAFYEGYKDWLYSSDRNIEGQLRTLESPNI